MEPLYFILPILAIIAIAFLAIKIGAIALRMTGLSAKKAEFQALSAFTTTGFTTQESELIVNHPQRRKIVMTLMVLGNAGLVTMIATFITSFLKSGAGELPVSLILIIVGIFILYRIARNKKFVQKWEEKIAEKLLQSRTFKESNIEYLLDLPKRHAVVQIQIRQNSLLVGKRISELDLDKKDISVLGIEREEIYTPKPNMNEFIKTNDKLLLYGDLKAIKDNF